MTREIKFRAWCKEEKEMREVAMLRWENGRMSRIAGYWKGTRDNGWTDYDPQEDKIVLMQYTGLKDKNGMEIAEGDIVEYDKDFQGKPFLDEDGYRFEVGFSCGSFLIFDPHDIGERGGFSGFYLHTPAMEVIGNIYQNPELLSTPTPQCDE